MVLLIAYTLFLLVFILDMVSPSAGCVKRMGCISGVFHSWKGSGGSSRPERAISSVTVTTR